jgi:hypothetical protein
VDIPEIHCFSEEVGDEIFCRLAETENMALFELTVFKRLIEFKWPLILRYTQRSLFWPYCAYQFFYLIFSNAFWKTREEPGNRAFTIIYQIFLCVFSGYFILIEVNQLRKQGAIPYFVDGGVWNFLDLGPPILIGVNFFFDVFRYYHIKTPIDGRSLEACMLATIALFMWLKFLYFLRIFESTGYLTRIIRAVLY